MVESLDQETAVPAGSQATQLRIVFGRPQFQHDRLTARRAQWQAALAGGQETTPAQRVEIEGYIRLIDDFFAMQEAVALRKHRFEVAEQRRQSAVSSEEQIKANHASLQAEVELHRARVCALEAELALNLPWLVKSDTERYQTATTSRCAARRRVPRQSAPART